MVKSLYLPERLEKPLRVALKRRRAAAPTRRARGDVNFSRTVCEMVARCLRDEGLLGDDGEVKA